MINPFGTLKIIPQPKKESNKQYPIHFFFWKYIPSTLFLHVAEPLSCHKNASFRARGIHENIKRPGPTYKKDKQKKIP